jgi:hypothetical protein
VGINLRKSPSAPVGATFMVARWGRERGLVFPMRKMNMNPGDLDGHLN